MTISKKLLGEIMVDLGLITLEQVNQTRRHQMTAGGRLIGECLVELGHATSDSVRRAMEIQQTGEPA